MCKYNITSIVNYFIKIDHARFRCRRKAAGKVNLLGEESESVFYGRSVLWNLSTIDSDILQKLKNKIALNTCACTAMGLQLHTGCEGPSDL